MFTAGSVGCFAIDKSPSLRPVTLPTWTRGTRRSLLRRARSTRRGAFRLAFSYRKRPLARRRSRPPATHLPLRKRSRSRGPARDDPRPRVGLERGRLHARRDCHSTFARKVGYWLTRLVAVDISPPHTPRTMCSNHTRFKVWQWK